MKTKLALASLMLMVLLAFSTPTIAGVSVNIGVNLPPLVISAPPVVAVIPGTDVYFCPDFAVDIFFYDGYWYRSYEGIWYRAVDYNGPWTYIVVASVPTVFFHLPTGYRVGRYQRIPYADLHRNWRAWQRDRYWEHHAWGRNDLGRGREIGRRQVGQYRGPQRREQGKPSMHRETGVAPRYEQRHAPAPQHTGPAQLQRREQSGPSMHREMGVAPRYEQRHAPPSGHTGHSGPTRPMNRSTPRAPAQRNEHGR